MSNLAHELNEPQGELVQFPRKERQVMSKREEGYTRMPNSLIDDHVMAKLSDKAFKCLMFIVRQTVGFDRPSHKIAITQFQEYCGIKKRDTVMSCIKDLEDLGVVKVDRNQGCLNEYFYTPDQSHQKGLVPEKGTSTAKRDGTSTAKGDYTSPVERYPIKEKLKENIKESTCSENSVDAVLKLWTPNLDDLNSWLQRSGIQKMTQAEVDRWLIEINGYYSNKIQAGLLTETQMYTNFVKWIKRNFTVRKPVQTQQSNPPQKPHRFGQNKSTIRDVGGSHE
ncbi:replication protein [Acinetobacter bereziniae]|uniref:replication protein n=1 Tax=Acinetobacter bereziniae TaxID=106648 RepID=UPI0015800953|nr:replication protein [Acinetobacter bereziniae]NUF61562.1 replication protein [Acinetobacter bereziniae]NUG06168.1 replication protein [Acinetobacter bereziniae]NUG62323.1 replication protein [Acinetobacter bereziniae]NUG69175.1 replication protein [Acinetobacter bereziniae]NUG78531.1 replication protein [Acinetobacter bereziniae]